MERNAADVSGAKIPDAVMRPFIANVFARWAVLLTVFIGTLHYGRAEVFTSMADVQNVVNTERKIVDVLRLLVHSEKARMEAIER